MKSKCDNDDRQIHSHAESIEENYFARGVRELDISIVREDDFSAMPSFLHTFKYK